MCPHVILEKRVDQIFRDLEWGRKHNSELLKKYKGKTIGIYDGKVLGTIKKLYKLEKQNRLPVSMDQIAKYWVDPGNYLNT